MTAAAVNSMFGTYCDSGGQWSGDSTVPVPLPDGRDAWFFSDTFLGTVNADRSRPSTSPFIHNSIVVRNGNGLVSTVYGGPSGAPDSLVEPAGTWAVLSGGFYNGEPYEFQVTAIGATCEAYKRANLRHDFGRGIANAYGPDLLLHEVVHSGQWEAYSTYKDFLKWYIAASLYSLGLKHNARQLGVNRYDHTGPCAVWNYH